MASDKSCKSCKYSRAHGSTWNGWCLLRKIKVHSEIAPYAFCHHWTQQEPSLPILDNINLRTDHQLDFARELVTNKSKA